MTKKLQELFELPENEINGSEHHQEIELDTSLVTKETFSNLEKIENALPQVRGLELTDLEMDELTTMATNGYKDLMDLGMQVDSRFSAEIFGVAGNMLGHAITAKTAKINKKLKMIELQLKKATLDIKQQTKDEQVEATPLGEGRAIDRNELLKTLLAKNTDK
jgi:uncharacterized protein YecA (UPF0149 family)